MEKINRFTANHDLGLLLIRIALGVTFIVHGWAKVANLSGTAGFFESIGLAAALAYIVAAIEFLGGIAVLLGVGIRTAGFLIALVMVGAIATVKADAGFMGGYELDFTLLLVALGLVFTGAGKYSARLSKRASATM
jgi:putative oxidoreductase